MLGDFFSEETNYFCSYGAFRSFCVLINVLVSKSLGKILSSCNSYFASLVHNASRVPTADVKESSGVHQAVKSKSRQQ